jgi:Na+/melibiose symporter-like transporter
LAKSNGGTFDLSTRNIWLFALPSLPLGLMHGPVSGILPSIYISHFGLSAVTVGVVTLIARLFDAISDPIIGHISDQTATRWGRRKPFVVGGTVIICVATYFVYLPPVAPSLEYFLGWFLLLYLGWTIAEIPLAAWAVEATGTLKGRMQIFMSRLILSTVAGAIVYLLPFLPVFPTREITAETMRWIGMISLVLLPPCVFAAVAFVPRGQDLSVHARGGLWAFVKSASGNGPFQVYLTIALLSGFGTGVYFALSFLFFTQVLGYIESFLILALANIAVGIPAYYFWRLVSDRIGSVGMWSLTNFSIALCLLSFLFIPAGQAYFPVTLMLTCVTSFFASGYYLGGGPILADVVDYDILKSGINRAGSYFAVQALVGKATAGIGGGVGFALLGLIGYDATVGAANTAQAIWNFRLAMVGVSVVMLTLSGLIVLRFPITGRRRHVIRKRIESRTHRAERPKTTQETLNYPAAEAS